MDVFPLEHTRAAWLFNHARYFEAHEQWEKLWLKEPPGARKTYYQMLIHAAVSLHHWARGNRKGLALQFRHFNQKAEAFRHGIHWGIDVSLLQMDMCAMLEPFAAAEDIPLPPFDRYPLVQLILYGLEPTPVNEPPRHKHCKIEQEK